MGSPKGEIPPQSKSLTRVAASARSSQPRSAASRSATHIRCGVSTVLGPYPALPWRRPRSNHCKSMPAGPAGQLLLHQVIILSVRHPSDENVPSETSERGGQDHVSGGVAGLEGRGLGAEHGRVEVPVVAACMVAPRDEHPDRDGSGGDRASTGRRPAVGGYAPERPGVHPIVELSRSRSDPNQARSTLSGSCVQPAADTLGDHTVTFCNSASE